MRKAAIAIIVASTLSVLFGTDSTTAAEVKPWQSNSCRFLLKGEIVPGDLAKLEAIQRAGQMVRSVDPASGDPDARLCLDSAGGNFIEGVNIAKFVSENGWGTTIDNGQTCLSACAVIFMAGRLKGPEEDSYNRRLHVRGKLGFHRPILVLPDSSTDSYSASAVQAAYDAAIDSVVVFLSMGNQLGSFSNTRRVRMSLFEEMMKHKGNDFFFIDTVDKAGRWEIEVFGYQPPKQFTEANIYNACSNFIAWANDESNNDSYSLRKRGNYIEALVERRMNFGALYGIYDKSKITESFVTSPLKSGLAEVLCEIHVYRGTADADRVAGCFFDGFTGLQYGKCSNTTDDFDVWLDPISIHEPQVRLADLASVQANSTSPTPAVSSSAATAILSLRRLENSDLTGADLRKIKGDTAEACLLACQQNNACVGATYDKWNALCILKSQADDVTVSAKAVSWVLPNSPLSQPQTARVSIVKRRDRSFSDMNYRNFPSRSYDECAARCKEEEKCIALNFRDGRYCELISSASEYMPSRGDIAGYKSGRGGGGVQYSNEE